MIKIEESEPVEVIKNDGTTFKWIDTNNHVWVIIYETYLNFAGGQQALSHRDICGIRYTRKSARETVKYIKGTPDYKRDCKVYSKVRVYIDKYPVFK